MGNQEGTTGTDNATGTEGGEADSGELSTQPGADPTDEAEIEQERQERLDPETVPSTSRWTTATGSSTR